LGKAFPEGVGMTPLKSTHKTRVGQGFSRRSGVDSPEAYTQNKSWARLFQKEWGRLLRNTHKQELAKSFSEGVLRSTFKQEFGQAFPEEMG
jgi:hypothetical protein